MEKPGQFLAAINTLTFEELVGRLDNKANKSDLDDAVASNETAVLHIQKTFSSLSRSLYGADFFVVDLATTENVARSDEKLIDGVMTASSRVLIKSQTNAIQNGLFDTKAGTWTRTADASSGTPFKNMLVYVLNGTVNGGKMFLCKPEGTIEVGVSPIVFHAFDGRFQNKADNTEFQKAKIRDFASANGWRDLPSFVFAPFPGANLATQNVKFSRASRASYWNAQGDLAWANIDEPRLAYDAKTGEFLGSLIEASDGRNIVRWPNKFDEAHWTLRGFQTPLTSEVRKKASFTRLIPTTASGQHSLSQTSTYQALTTETEWTESVLASPIGNSDRFALRVARGGTLYAFFYFNVRTGDAYAITSGVTPNSTLTASTRFHIQDEGDNIFRSEVTFPVPAGTSSLTFELYAIEPGTNNRSFTGDGESGWLIAHAQTEQGPFATSIFGETAAIETRAADIVKVSDGLSADWFNQLKGTFYLEALSLDPSNEATILCNSGGSNQFRAYLASKSGTDNFVLSASNIGSVGVNERPGAARLTTGSLVASYNGETGKVAACADLSEVATGQGVKGALGLSGDILIGRNADGSMPFHGYVKTIAYWPTDLGATSLRNKSQRDFPTEWLSGMDEVVIYVIYGQSRARNDGTGPEITVDPILPGIAGMFNGGVYPNKRRDAPSTTSIASGRLKTIVDLREGSGIETPSSGFALGVSRYLRPGQRLLIINGARGGATYSQLKKGTQPYNNVIAILKRAATIFSNLGVRVSIGGLVALWGEADRADTLDVFLAKQNEIQRDFSNDVSAIFGQQQVLVYVDQTSAWRGLSADMLTSEVPLAQLQFGLTNPNGRCLAPSYPFSTYDGVHWTNIESFRAGKDYGVATGNRFPLHIAKAVRTGASIVVSITGGDESSDVVIDTALVTDPGNYGFEWLQTGGAVQTIASVAKTGFRQITVTLSGDPGAPTSESIAYARTAPGGAGPSSGPRGNIRDATNWLSQDRKGISST